MGSFDVLTAWNDNYRNTVDNKEQSILLKFELHSSGFDEEFKYQFVVT